VKPNDVLAEGMEIDARVLEVSNENRRISISIKEVEPINPVTEMDENAQSSEEANETYVSEQDQFNAPSGELEIPQQEEEIPQQEEEEPEA
jgi:4-hydroxy-3-methylbut-2-enyl diphosphate reductase